jgi:hypothetical protein
VKSRAARLGTQSGRGTERGGDRDDDDEEEEEDAYRRRAALMCCGCSAECVLARCSAGIAAAGWGSPGRGPSTERWS